MPATVVPSRDLAFRVADGPFADGLSTAVLTGAEEGSIHLEVALSRLEPGGVVRGHRHFYEESFYILEGEVLVSIDGQAFVMRDDDFGLVPSAIPHAWANRGDAPVTWFRMRSPQPRSVAGTGGTFPAHEVAVPTHGASVGDPHPTQRYVGHFEDHHLPAPGPISMKGYRGPNVTSVSIWMMIDEYVGAMHHTMFMVQFVPGATTHPGGDHFHPFEEAYYFLQGSAIAHLDGQNLPVEAGDLVFAGTNALHGYTMTSDVPVRWIEVQAPAPTASGAFVFPADWQ